MTNDNSEKTSPEENTGSPPPLPPMEFSSLVTPFYIQSLLTLEAVKDPKSPDDLQQLKLVQRLIDLLDLLKTKTEGNLDPGEANILESCLHQLKMIYLKKKESA